jgi:hypothetical protein
MASDLTVQTIRGPGSGANANQILIPSGQKIIASDAGGVIIPGSILQVKSVNSNAATSIAGNAGFTNTGTYIDIVPQYSNSRILVIAQGHVYRNAAGHNYFRVINQTTGTTSGVRGGRDQYAGYHEDVTIVWENLPGSTSSQRYEMQFADRDNNSGVGLYWNDGGSYQSGMTVMEIKV